MAFRCPYVFPGSDRRCLVVSNDLDRIDAHLLHHHVAERFPARTDSVNAGEYRWLPITDDVHERWLDARRNAHAPLEPWPPESYEGPRPPTESSGSTAAASTSGATPSGSKSSSTKGKGKRRMTTCRAEAAGRGKRPRSSGPRTPAGSEESDATSPSNAAAASTMQPAGPTRPVQLASSSPPPRPSGGIGLETFQMESGSVAGVRMLELFVELFSRLPREACQYCMLPRAPVVAVSLSYSVWTAAQLRVPMELNASNYPGLDRFVRLLWTTSSLTSRRDPVDAVRSAEKCASIVRNRGLTPWAYSVFGRQFLPPAYDRKKHDFRRPRLPPIQPEPPGTPVLRRRPVRRTDRSTRNTSRTLTSLIPKNDLPEAGSLM